MLPARRLSGGTPLVTSEPLMILIVVEVEEEEKLVAHDRTADVAAKLILDQVVARNDRGGVVAEPAVGDQRRIAMILVEVAVECVGAALGDKLELATAAGPVEASLPATSP